MKLLAALKRMDNMDWVLTFMMVAVISILSFAFYIGLKEKNDVSDMVEWCIEEGGVPVLGYHHSFRICVDADAVISR
jgi:hypothetical protein